jgi:hypothetical protein
MAINEVMDQNTEGMGHINPKVAPLTEVQNTFKTPNDGTPKYADEKEYELADAKEIDEDHPAGFLSDPFVPFDDLPDEPHRILTIRAVFVGLCCGALVNASNVYLGLKTGWTFTANLFGVSTLPHAPRPCPLTVAGHCWLRRRQVLLQDVRRAPHSRRKLRSP